jgi:DNA-3-methyladenine glycosylase II
LDKPFEQELMQAADYLSDQDAMLAPVIAAIGLSTMRPHKDYYRALVSSIIGQQLSVYAASAILERFIELFGGEFPMPEQLITVTPDQLRAIGFSYAKAGYVLDEHLDDLSNADVITELTAVKGIGEWTVHMFLMSCMGRLDVLPTGDLGIRKGVKALYGFVNVPTPAEVREIAIEHHWHPYESVASWYVWQSLNNEPV